MHNEFFGALTMNKPTTDTVSTTGSNLDRHTDASAQRRVTKPYAQNLVLHCALGCQKDLAALVRDFIADGVHYIDLAGPEGGHAKQIIDALLAAGGFSDARISTAWYPGEKLESIVAFVHALREDSRETQVVQL